MGNRVSTLDPFTEFNGKDLHEEIEQLRKKLSRLNLEEPLRIVVCGDRGAGKSALVNTIISALEGKLVQIAKVGSPEGGVTLKYVEYKIILSSKKKKKTLIVLCDTEGVGTKDTTKQTDAVLAALEGKFTSNERMGATPMLPSGRKKHAVYVIIVRDAKFVISVKEGSFQDSTWKDIETHTNAESIPVAIVLTKCDKLDPAVGRDITKLYKSPEVDKAIDTASKMFHGLPKSRIFPIVNYTDQRKADPAMTIQILYALREIVSDVHVCMSRIVDKP